MIIHIDMSGKPHQKQTIGVACVSKDKKFHVGLALHKKEVLFICKKRQIDHDTARFYAICIFVLLKDHVKDITKIIVCNDAPFIEVKEYLDLLFIEVPNYKNVKIISITEYRDDFSNDQKIKSSAHRHANSYRKRALKKSRWELGTKLNVISLRASEFEKLWEKIEIIMK